MDLRKEPQIPATALPTDSTVWLVAKCRAFAAKAPAAPGGGGGRGEEREIPRVRSFQDEITASMSRDLLRRRRPRLVQGRACPPARLRA